MIRCLSYAEGADTSDSGLAFIVVALVIIVVVFVLAMIPVATVRRRRLGKTEGIAAMMVLWGALAAGTGIYITNAQMSWSREYNKRVMSGYFDPHDLSDRPNQPWWVWGILVAAYAGAVVWSQKTGPYIPPPPAAGFGVIPPPDPAPREEGRE